MRNSVKSLEEIRELFKGDTYATATTGIEIMEVSEGYAKVGLTVDERHMNAGGRVMGAVYFTMADFAFAVANNTNTNEGPMTFTLSSQINFLTAAKGRRLTAEARAVRDGKKVSFYEVQVRDDLDNLLATVSSNGFKTESQS